MSKVRGDVQAPEPEVVGGVHHDAQVPVRQGGLEARRQLRAADPAGKGQRLRGCVRVGVNVHLAGYLSTGRRDAYAPSRQPADQPGVTARAAAGGTSPLVLRMSPAGCYLRRRGDNFSRLSRKPEDGFGLQQVILEDVAAGLRGPTALTWNSSRYVAPTGRERRLPGFEEAVEIAEKKGFPVLVRNSGGGAVAANEGSISFSLTFPVEDLRHGLYERYGEGVSLISSALRKASACRRNPAKWRENSVPGPTPSALAAETG